MPRPVTRPLALAPVVAAVLWGCASGRAQRPPAPPPQAASQPVVKLEPIKVVGQTDTPDALEFYDAQVLFDRGSEFLDSRHHAEARQYFQKLLDEFPDSALAQPARYNLGVALMETKDPQTALMHFDAYRETATGKNLLDATFKRGSCLAMLGRYQEVAEVFDGLLEGELKPEDRIEALVDSGIAYFMLEDKGTAEWRFKEAVKLRAKGEQETRLDSDYFNAQALFYLGEIARLEYSEFKMTMPEGPKVEDKLAEQLEEKCQRLLRAQYQFLKVIRTGNAGWAAAAGFKVGMLYQELHDEMVTLPVPPDLTEEQAQIYRLEVRKKVAILVRKAISIWESTTSMARRTGQNNVWVEKTEQSLNRMRVLLKEVDDMERAEKDQAG
jgi:tetratricopeptide (TPR) repeat protein